MVFNVIFNNISVILWRGSESNRTSCDTSDVCQELIVVIGNIIMYVFDVTLSDNFQFLTISLGEINGKISKITDN